MYEEDKYPFNCLGPVKFLWKPIESGDENRTLWIWTHPAIFDSVAQLFRRLFNINDEERSESPQMKKQKLDAETEEALNEDAKAQLRNPIFRNDKVVIKCLRDRLVRFKLLGPLSTNILANALKSVDFGVFDTPADDLSKWSDNNELIE